MRNFLAALVLLVPFTANAVPDLNAFTGVPGHVGILENGAELWSPTDFLSGPEDDSDFLVQLENAGFANTNAFGIYKPGNPALKLEIFGGADAVGAVSVLAWDLNTHLVEHVASGNTLQLDDTFDGVGFYLDVPASGDTFYSETLLNADGFDHFISFSVDEIPNPPGCAVVLCLGDQLIAVEDLFGGGDQDYDDFVVSATDLGVLTGVPVPGPLALMGLGLVGLGLVRRIN
jgi:hypothetical protein